MKISIKNLSFSYSTTKTIFEGINLEFDTKDIVLLLGANGSGKTTFCRIISNLESNYVGDILFNNSFISKSPTISKRLIYLKQEPIANIVGTNANEDLQIWQTQFSGEDNDVLKKERIEALQNFRIDNILNEPTWELSNGQIKRIGLASLLLNYDKYWILDEPTTGIEDDIVRDFISILKKRKKQNLGALIITHRDEIFSKIVDNMLVIKKHKIVKI